jgi:hypothetical protein
MFSCDLELHVTTSTLILPTGPSPRIKHNEHHCPEQRCNLDWQILEKTAFLLSYSPISFQPAEDG